MKKLVLFAAVAVAISLSACKKAAPAQEEPIQEDEIIVVDEATGEEVVEVIEAAEEAAE